MILTSMTRGTKAWQWQVGHTSHRGVGPGILQGTAGKTSGKWRAADLPQWDANNVVSSNWGGSTDAVLKLSKNQIAASQLALFINTDKESALKMANEQFLFPALNEILEGSRLPQPGVQVLRGPEGEREVRADLRDRRHRFPVAAVHGLRVHELRRDLGKAFADKTDAVAGLQAWQDACAKYAKDQGFTVA